MRRLLLLALAAAPALVLAQTLPLPAPGKVSFGSEARSSVDAFINSAECAGGKILVRWDTDSATSTTGATTQYQVYAHNSTSAHNESSTGPCPIVDGDLNDTALKVGKVHGPFLVKDTNPGADPNSPLGATNVVELDATLIVSAARKSCGATGEEDIVLCVQANGSGGAARGKMILSTQPPSKATGLGAGSGSGALNVVWTAPAGSPEAEYYVVEASFAGTSTAAIDPAQIPTVRSGAVTATSFRLEGLVNTVVYNVRVHSFSTADNASISDAVQGRPELANDFWNSYRNAGGQEEGGCGVGAAGPLGLLLAAAAVALRRRRS